MLSELNFHEATAAIDGEVEQRFGGASAQIADLRTRLEASEAAVSHLEGQKKGRKGENKKPRRGLNRVLNMKFPSSASKQQSRHNALNEC